MTQIKNIIFCSRQKLKNALNCAGFEFTKSDFGPLLLDFIHHLLPLRVKFASESFVALDNGRVQGLITLEKDNKSRKRLKISRLFLEQNSYDTGKLLVDYVVSRYSAMGAVSYQVVVQDNLEDMLSLFIDGCGFRKNATEYLYKIQNDEINAEDNAHPEGFKFYKNSRAAEASRLYNSNINSYQRHNFARSPQQFCPDFAQGMRDKISYAYVLEDELKGRVYGYFNVYTFNNTDYVLDFVIDCAFEIYFADALGFIAHILSKRTKNWNLYVKIKSYFSNYESLKNHMESNNYPLVKTSWILTKDFLKEAKQGSLLNSAKIIFNDITPAYKNSSTKTQL